MVIGKRHLQQGLEILGGTVVMKSEFEIQSQKIAQEERQGAHQTAAKIRQKLLSACLRARIDGIPKL